jgi:hypothetical protein
MKNGRGATWPSPNRPKMALHDEEGCHRNCHQAQGVAHGEGVCGAGSGRR